MLNKKSHGFTLQELMICIAIVGILSSFAIPSYQSSIKKTRRGDVQGVLMGFSGAMERFYTENYTYVGSTASTPPEAPISSLYASEAPLNGGTKYYDLTVESATASAYVL